MWGKNEIIAVFLDADGVLWKDIGPGGILTGEHHSIQNLSLLPSLEHKKYLRIVVSNQTLAARNEIGYVKFKFITNIFFRKLMKLKLISDFAICYHHPNAKNLFLNKMCKCRKPLPGLINSMVKKHNITPEKSFLIGDRITDIQSGAAAGVRSLYLIVSLKMLEINENSSNRPLQLVFTPLKELKEFSKIKEFLDEN